VTWEYPTPGQSLARERPWGSFATGGSLGIRGSHQYVREGGALAREMLIMAAAASWGVDAADCSARDSVITHGPSGGTLTYGDVADAAADMDVPARSRSRTRRSGAWSANPSRAWIRRKRSPVACATVPT
jgi:isoquinoline 1-oxidoreductase beta subunit